MLHKIDALAFELQLNADEFSKYPPHSVLSDAMRQFAEDRMLMIAKRLQVSCEEISAIASLRVRRLRNEGVEIIRRHPMGTPFHFEATRIAGELAAASVDFEAMFIRHLSGPVNQPSLDPRIPHRG